MAGYDFTAIERKWQAYWDEHDTFRQPNPSDEGFRPRPKLYVLDMFPYPSGAGLHVGHPEGYTATDIVSRYARMRGYNVLHPMGYDAFGLPAEQYAVEHGVHPRETTQKNIENIERQIRMFGFSYDWSRRVATTDPDYYRWTQWIFLKLFNSWYDPEADAARPISELISGLEAGELVVDFGGNVTVPPISETVEAIGGVPGGFYKFQELDDAQKRRLIDDHRLAYQDEVPVNWCPKLGTVLANEEVTAEGRSERGDHPVYRRALRQWMLRITAYAERLLEDIDAVDWPEPIKIMQRNWIGRSTGADVDFPLSRGTAFQAVPVAGEGVPFEAVANDELVRACELDASERPGLWAETFSPCDPFPKDADPPHERAMSRRNLLHVGVPGATYFVTFRARHEQSLSQNERSIVANAVLFWHRQRCVVYGCVVMNDHVHMAIRPLDGYALGNVLQSIKGYAAREINRFRSSEGRIWQDESFDHVIRDSRSLTEFLYYMLDNPVKRELADRADEYPWTYINAEEVRTEIGNPFGHSLKDCATMLSFFEQRAESGFPHEPEDGVIRVYTTRPDTLFGATYMVLAPEHPLVMDITDDACRDAVSEYVEQAKHKSELERTAETKDKTGVFTGAFAVNPVNRREIPIWVADYVMMGYGTGAIMAVPAHDTRDFEFARQFDLPIVQVVEPPEGEDWRGYTGEGVAVNSGEYDGLATSEFKRKITEDLESAGLGCGATNYKLRDWLFSRQRYWGEPFPVVHCPDCGTVALPESALPLTLPEMEDFTPSASDDPDAVPTPPLGKAADWVNAECPSCGERAKRELNTMPQWAGSCWYYLRFLDPDNADAPFDPAVERYWMTSIADETGEPALQAAGGVDLYVGGAEHAVLHLLYARFWHKVLYDLGYVSTAEPFGRLFNQGMIRSFAYRDKRGVYLSYDQVDLSDDAPTHAETGEPVTETVEKMSKSLKNVVNPDEVIEQFGADTFRLYEMFMGPLEASKPWNTRDVPGVHRFLRRVWNLANPGLEECSIDESPHIVAEEEASKDTERALHKLIKKVGEDIEAMKFNTAIAAMMEFVNTVYKDKRRRKWGPGPQQWEIFPVCARSQFERFVLVLAPFAPHLAEELWERLGHDGSLAHEPWPTHDESLIAAEQVELAVQINGKTRSRITVDADADEEHIIAAALADGKIAAAIEGKDVVKRIVVPGRLVNLVVK